LTKKFLLLLLFSLGLCLISLDQSLWLDEAISANVVKNYSYGEIVTKFSPSDFHPPLYYLMLKGWTTVFGYSEVSLRMPSVIFFLVTIYMVYLLAGSGAALLTGLNPLLIYYSQETRMYSMVTMLLMLAIYSFRRKKYWWFNVLSFLSFMTFYGSVFLLVALALYLLIKKKYKELILSNLGIVVAILVLSPLLRAQMQNSQEMLLEVKNWSLVLGKANLKNLLLIPIKITSVRISFYPKFGYYFIVGGWAIFVFKPFFSAFAEFLPLRKGRLKNINFYGYLFWMNLLIGTVFSIFTPMMQYFRFLYLVPVMTMVIRKSKVITVGFLVFSLVYLLDKNMWREDWKSLSRDVGVSVYMISSFGDPIKYYRPEVTIQDVRNNITEKEITVVPYGEVIHGVDHNKILTAAGYDKKTEVDYRGVSLETWQRN
jgi:uncharacterized membrane protein